ncbi:tyrosine-type recombinase/integrase [Dietzia sp. PP-33]|jgi:integrase|uniref:site-specific integrase n=1 Tax=Dietzia sp. PP-33 TaxID=2957500 RepID=UPI0029A950F1|nr:tyrosine-type recombinase/integrase [Dietzia sp. PP-33]MDX2358576.1 site-specific integrase [Dietzia sp. PP-33]
MKGSVRKYTVRGQKPGVSVTRWMYVVDLGTDPVTGKRVQERRRGFDRKSDADDALAKRVGEVSEKRVDLTGRNLTVSAWLDTWLEQKIANGLRPGTAASYRGHIDRYLKPLLGSKKLVDLSPADVEWLLVEIRKPRPAPAKRTRGQHATPKPMGPATARRVHATLRSALSTAKMRRYVTFNAAADVELPKVARHRVKPWSRDELTKFLNHANTEADGPLFEMYATTGLRRGELLGLRWADIDLNARILTVRQQLTENTQNMTGPACSVCGQHHGSVAFGEPKTENGHYRRVPLLEGVVGALMVHRLAQGELRTDHADIWVDHDLVFPRDDGTPLLPSGVSARFHDLTDAAGLRRVRLHDLRHGYVSLLLESGVDIAAISKIVGHSSIQITADIYGHLADTAAQSVVDAALNGLSSVRDHGVTTGPVSPPVTSASTSENR